MGDSNDHFRIEIVGYDEKNPLTHHLKAILNNFRLIHVNTGCAIFSSSVKLPEWGKRRVFGIFSFLSGLISSPTFLSSPPPFLWLYINAARLHSFVVLILYHSYLLIGFGQQEVTCALGGKYANTLWTVEGNENPLCKSNFFIR